MASIHRETIVEVAVDRFWDALRDVGALHTRLVPGFVTDTRLEDGARIVTFGNGLVARELLLDVDPRAQRVAWSARSERLAHHNASLQLFDAGGGRTRAVWIADLLPDAMAPAVAAMIEEGLATMKRTLERAGPS